MTDEELRSMTREELEDLLAQLMFRLRQCDSQDLKNEIQTRSQRLGLGFAPTN
jgi:hypothetical protein